MESIKELVDTAKKLSPLFRAIILNDIMSRTIYTDTEKEWAINELRYC